MPAEAGCRFRVAGHPEDPGEGDSFTESADEVLIEDRRFHRQNVSVISQRTLARFERALGRRANWSFPSHRLEVCPHAFAGANAFYSRERGAIEYGHFPGSRGTVYACLSHDVVAHETAHALLDGLRRRYLEPSSPDQAAFHEGFADIVALLSVFSLPEVVGAAIGGSDAARVPRSKLAAGELRRSLLFGLGEQMGAELSASGAGALRQPLMIEPAAGWIDEKSYAEPHRRGEILAAAVLNGFFEVWTRRLATLGGDEIDRGRVVEDGFHAAEHLLTMSIRAIDYAPPVDLEFHDFLSALLTADAETHPDDSRFRYRDALRASFAGFGIRPRSKGPGGVWEPPEGALCYEGLHFESMQRDAEEVFRFLWRNREALCLEADSDTHVESVRPCLRLGADGFLLRETVAEYVQTRRVSAGELGRLAIRKPDGMTGDFPLTLHGGGALIFDEYGRLKFHARNRIDNPARQTLRLEHLWREGFLR